MLRMLAVFWVLMSTAGLITEGLFTAAGLVPTMRPTTIAPAHFSWNYTTYLNLIFIALFGLLYWTYRNRERLGGGTGYAKDPVCGMQVEIAHAPASLRHGPERVYFCSDHCADLFARHRSGGTVELHERATIIERLDDGRIGRRRSRTRHWRIEQWLAGNGRPPAEVFVWTPSGTGIVLHGPTPGWAGPDRPW